ncbi:MAG TPA: hypothetical protein VGG35_04855 [Streptosporangiaceae bacterium]
MRAEMIGGPGPAGSTVVVRQSHAQREGLFGGLVVVFVLAFARGFPGAATTAGKVAVTILCAGLVILIAAGWISILRHPPRLEISGPSISYIDGKGKVTTLSRESGDELRFVSTGSGRYRSRGMMVSGSATILPLPFFSAGQVREQTTACGWQFRSGRRSRS